MSRIIPVAPLVSVLAFLFCGIGCSEKSSSVSVKDLDNYQDWGIYRGDQKANQFSKLDQVNVSNVSQLEPAWTFNTGDATRNSAIQSNPIIVNGTLYLVSPVGQLLALDAETGEQSWKFDPRTPDQKNGSYSVISRGVAYWSGGTERRIFFSTQHYVYSVNIDTGRLDESFGDAGKLDFRYGLGIDSMNVDTGMTSPAAVFEDSIILGTRVGESYGSAPGHIRSYDARTGELRWTFHTIPEEGEFGYETWEWVEGEVYGGANPWGGLTIDEERGWVFAATGSPTYDFYGANRKGQNLFGNCVLALDARTGERKWHFQTVHHDIWDMDNPPAPMLVELEVDGKPRDAVVQMTKMGYLFVLDRDTGEPIFPVEERPVPSSDIPGEEAWPTQPFPLKPPPLVRQGFSKDDLNDLTPEYYAKAMESYGDFSDAPIFTPPSLGGHVLFPGMSGGMEYHGASFDPSTGMLYVNVNESSNVMRMLPMTSVKDESKLSEYEKGKLLYQLNCSVCHGLELKGAPSVIPSLANSPKSDSELMATIKQGRGAMPSFGSISDERLKGILDYLRNPDGKPLDMEKYETKTVYLLDGYRRFVDEKGVPNFKPPWGSLAAVDLNDGTIKWKRPLGEYPELAKQGFTNTGTRNFGGSVATAGGLVFVGATADEKFRAFDTETGEMLWEYQLPFGGYATPSVYEIDGRQYIVICAGGGKKVGTPSGDAVIAFTLPE